MLVFIIKSYGPYCILHFQMLLWRFVALTWSWVPRQGDRVPYRLCAHPISSPPETSCGIQHHRLSERHDTLTLEGFQARSRHYHCIPRGDLDPVNPVKWNRGISASLVSWNDVNLCQILEKSMCQNSKPFRPFSTFAKQSRVVFWHWSEALRIDCKRKDCWRAESKGRAGLQGSSAQLRGNCSTTSTTFITIIIFHHNHHIHHSTRFNSIQLRQMKAIQKPCTNRTWRLGSGVPQTWIDLDEKKTWIASDVDCGEATAWIGWSVWRLQAQLCDVWTSQWITYE